MLIILRKLINYPCNGHGERRHSLALAMDTAAKVLLGLLAVAWKGRDVAAAAATA